MARLSRPAAPVARWIAGAAAAATFFLAPAAEARGQTLATGVVEGRARDAAGAALADVALVLLADEGGASRSAVTTRDGTFSFVLLPPGSYTVMAERVGYRPKWTEGVPVQPGERLRLEVVLEAAPPPVEAPEVVRFEGGGGGSRAGWSQRLSTLPLAELPWERRDLVEAAGLSTVATPALSVEGLPPAFGTLTIDGVPHAPARHPGLAREADWQAAFPLGAFLSADLVTADPDLEWSGWAGGVLAAQTRRGPSVLAASGFGAWERGSQRAAGSATTGPSTAHGNSLWGGAQLGGPILRDTAHFALALEARRLASPLPRPWSPDFGGVPSLVAAASQRGVDLEPFLRPYIVESTVVSGAGRFDWQIGPGSTLSVRAAFAQIPRPERPAPAEALAPGALGHGGELLLTAGVASLLPRDLAYELRAGFGRGVRDYDDGLAAGSVPGAPTTHVASGDLRFGADPRLPGRFTHTTFTTTQSLEVTRGLHRLKAGVETDLRAYEETYAFGRRGEFFFADPQDFGSLEGAFVQTVASPLPVSFTAARGGAFVQDRWSPTPGLEVVGGVRYEVELLPLDRIRIDERWLRYTGLANVDVPVRFDHVGPRLGVTWDVGGQGRWVVRATAGTYASPVPPEVIAELLAVDGTPSARRGVGQLGSWPGPPGAQEAPDVGSRLTLLGPDFRGPLTRRASFGVGQQLGSLGTLHLSGSYRETDFLPRRADLNLLETPTVRDQHGRPVYGPLVRAGQLVATPRPNRRFTDFDLVSALNADGWSRYWGVTGALERDQGGTLGLFARYTYSEARDNWLPGAAGGPEDQLTPFPDQGAGDWREGRSDFDAPHRLAAGLELRVPGRHRPRVAAVYRYSSGTPFTPGFPVGVDVNADGSGRNDPAFVDGAIPGMPDTVRRWDCLRDQLGRFAARNACRTAGAHSLDVRVALGFGGAPGLAAELFAEGLGLIGSAMGEPDRALYLIDGTGSLDEDVARGLVTIPLMTNPDFGRLLERADRGRRLRIGLQVIF